MTRLAPLVLLVLAAGCGPLRPVLTPSLASVPRLAPDLVPEQGGSAVVVTSRSATGGVSGRAVDRDTGEPIAGVVVRSGDAGTATDIDGAFALSVAGARLVGGYSGYLSFDAPLGDGTAQRPSTVLIVMARDPEAVVVRVGAAP